MIYLPEEPDATRPDDWSGIPHNEWEDSDAVATPRGEVKIPDGCSCTVKCDSGADYRIDCTCSILSPFGINAPRVVDPESGEFPNPRDAGYDWVATRNPYVRSGGFPCDTCGNTKYAFE